jgi:8-oxo-dGTP pyrophosphatase MutT (NUDIX family)
MNTEEPKGKSLIPEHATRVFKGIIFDVYQWEQELYDGTTATFERLKRPGTSVVFGVFEDGKILLAEQEQPGRSLHIGAIAGRAEPGEDPLTVAKREFLEETGYEAEKFVLWDERQPADKIDWTVSTFIAKGLKKVAEQRLDAGEKITLKPVTFEELIDTGSSAGFMEKEVKVKFVEAKHDPLKKEQLRVLFDPKS